MKMHLQFRLNVRSLSAGAKSASSHAAALDHAAHCLASDRHSAQRGARRWGNVSPFRVGWRCKRVSRQDVRAMFGGVVIAVVCLPALLTLVWFSEVLAGCF